MQSNLLTILKELEILGFPAHIYQHQIHEGWFHQGTLLENVEVFLHSFWFDELTDERVGIFCLTSPCGIKGTATMIT